MFKGSWKTTTAAVLGVVALAATQGAAMLDGDPATVPNWALVVAALPGLVGLFFARDNDRSSEDVGAK